MEQKSENPIERTVGLGGTVPETDAVDMLKKAPAGIGNVPGAVPDFKKVDTFTTFTAEYTLIGEDVVVHFFATKEFPLEDGAYWQDRFPKLLNVVGRSHFSAGYPRLAAKFTPEMGSWWFRAQGYSHILDLDRFMLKFFSKLDGDLDTTKVPE